MAHPTPVYRETQPMITWARVAVWSVALVMAVVAVAGEAGGEGGVPWLAVAAVIAMPAAMEWLVGGMAVELDSGGVTLRMGRAGWIHRRLAWERVERAETATYRPIRDFGGWGIRFGRAGARAWTQRGNRAVVLYLRDGTPFYVGSDRPDRLLERMRFVSGRGLDGTV